MDGFTLYCLESGQAIRSFSTGPASVPVSKQVAFGEEGKVVIGGSDNGCVHVFNRRTGELIEMLHHTSATLVQTITVRLVMLVSASTYKHRYAMSVVNV